MKNFTLFWLDIIKPREIKIIYLRFMQELKFFKHKLCVYKLVIYTIVFNVSLNHYNLTDINNRFLYFKTDLEFRLKKKPTFAFKTILHK